MNKKKTSIFLLTLLIAILITFCAFGQGEYSSQKALELLDKAYAAHGGAQAVAALPGTVSSGTARIGIGSERELRESVLIETRGSGQRRETWNGHRGQRTRVFAGRSGWVVSGSQKASLAESRSANTINPYDPVSGVLRALQDRPFEAQYQGFESTVLGGAHRIRLRFPALVDLNSEEQGKGRILEAMIDAQTFIIFEIAVVSDNWDRNRPDMWDRWIYRDFRLSEGGLTVPFLIERWRYGAQQLEVRLDRYELTHSEPSFREPARP